MKGEQVLVALFALVVIVAIVIAASVVKERERKRLQDALDRAREQRLAREESERLARQRDYDEARRRTGRTGKDVNRQPYGPPPLSKRISAPKMSSPRQAPLSDDHILTNPAVYAPVDPPRSSDPAPSHDPGPSADPGGSFGGSDF